MMHLWVVAKPLPPGGVCAIITVCTRTCEQTCTLVRMLTVARQGQTCMRYCSSDAILEMPLIQPGSYVPASSLTGTSVGAILVCLLKQPKPHLLQEASQDDHAMVSCHP